MPVAEEVMVNGKAADAWQPEFARVVKVQKETYDTFTLTLEMENSTPASPFLPGQFSMLYVHGAGELPISISGDSHDHSKLVYTVRSVGKTTQALVSSKPGDLVGVRGPYGTHWPMKSARGKDVLIVAGGIGLAPLRPAILHVMRHRSDYGRLVLLYGARSPKDLIFRKELASWAKTADTQVLQTVDYGGLNWNGYVGLVTSLFRYVRLQPFHTAALVCGPEIMMRYVISELENRGLPQGDIYLSMERNMKCGVGFCGHCQYGPVFICKDGPVFPYQKIRPWLNKYEL